MMERSSFSSTGGRGSRRPCLPPRTAPVVQGPTSGASRAARFRLMRFVSGEEIASDFIVIDDRFRIVVRRKESEFDLLRPLELPWSKRGSRRQPRQLRTVAPHVHRLRVEMTRLFFRVVDPRIRGLIRSDAGDPLPVAVAERLVGLDRCTHPCIAAETPIETEIETAKRRGSDAGSLMDVPLFS